MRRALALSGVPWSTWTATRSNAAFVSRAGLQTEARFKVASRGVQRSWTPQTTFSCVCQAHWSRSYASGTAAQGIKEDSLPECETIKDALPFSKMPGPVALPVIGNIYDFPWTSLFYPNIYEFNMKRFRKYGPIYRYLVGSSPLLHLSDVAAIEKMHRLDGKYPRRLVIPSWKEWRENNGLSKGILIEDGERWKRMRQLLDKQMLRPSQVATYTEGFNDVISDFVEHLRKIRHPASHCVPNMDNELFHWSLEAIGTVLYETRFGGLSGERDSENEAFVQAVHDMFVSTAHVFNFPRKVALRVIPKWLKMHEDAWATIFRIGQKVIDGKIAEMEQKLEEGKEVKGFLSTLLSNQKMSVDEVYGNISELMAAAVDTTSNTMQWAFLEVAMDPVVQEKLYQEVTSIVPPGRVPSYDDVQQMMYLKCFLKEILRLYPVAGVETRILNEDMVLCGYMVPEGTPVIVATYVTGRNPDIYRDPEQIRPERWMRSEENKNTHSFAWLPFGFGLRMCIGRRVAELEMQLLLARVLQEFRLESLDAKPNPPVVKPLIVPQRPVNISFVDRKN